MTMSYMNVEKPGQKRVKQSEHSPPAKRPRTSARTTSLATKPCPEFNFRHKFSLLVVGPIQSGKTYFVQQIFENNRIVYEEQKSIRIFLVLQSMARMLWNVENIARKKHPI